MRCAMGDQNKYTCAVNATIIKVFFYVLDNYPLSLRSVQHCFHTWFVDGPTWLPRHFDVFFSHAELESIYVLDDIDLEPQSVQIAQDW